MHATTVAVNPAKSAVELGSVCPRLLQLADDPIDRLARHYSPSK
jgi:hypothetical protein